MINKTRAIIIIAWILDFPVGAVAQEKRASDAAESAKKITTPIAAPASVHFQNNVEVGISENHGLRNTLNVHSVVPIKHSGKFNLIASSHYFIALYKKQLFQYPMPAGLF